eukprot:tig00021518_g22036.t1
MEPAPTSTRQWELKALGPGAAFDDVSEHFLRHWPSGRRPLVRAIRRIVNKEMCQRYHERRESIEKRRGKAKLATAEIRYYHGTRVDILESIYSDGFVPPDDFCAASDCPRSRGLPDKSPSLCTVDCR